MKESFEKQWPATKTYDSLWKPILLLKSLSNCKEKNAHSTVLQNAWNIAKSWKKQFFDYFLIKIWIRKSNHQNQDIAKR